MRVILVLTGLTFCGLAKGKPTTQPFSKEVFSFQNAFLSKYPPGQVYEQGIARVVVEANRSKANVLLPTAKLSVAVDGMKEIDFRRWFEDTNLYAQKEYVSGLIGDRRLHISVYPARADTHVFDHVFEFGYGKAIVDRVWVEEIKQQYARELDAFDFIVSMKREVILSKPWPESAKCLALWQTYAQSLIRSGDNLTRFDVDNLAIFITMNRDGEVLRANGKVFNRENGRWVANLLILLESNSDDSHGKILDAISRLRLIEKL